MAVSTTSWFNNGIMGLPQIGADVDIYETSANPKFAVGTRFIRSDGNEYVYGHFGTLVGHGGLLVANDFSESGTGHILGRIYATGSVTAIAGETIKPGTLGSHYVEIKMGGITADAYAGGYLTINSGDGGMYQYRVRGNTASSAKTSGAQVTFYLELYETLQQSLTGNSSMRITGSPYSNLESAKVSVDVGVSGVTTASHAVSTYGWIQSAGIAGVRTDASGATTAGSVLALSLSFAGCCTSHIYSPCVAGTHWFARPIIGYCINPGQSAAVSLALVKLQL